MGGANRLDGVLAAGRAAGVPQTAADAAEVFRVRFFVRCYFRCYISSVHEFIVRLFFEPRNGTLALEIALLAALDQKSTKVPLRTCATTHIISSCHSPPTKNNVMIPARVRSVRTPSAMTASQTEPRSCSAKDAASGSAWRTCTNQSSASSCASNAVGDLLVKTAEISAENPVLAIPVSTRGTLRTAEWFHGKNRAVRYASKGAIKWVSQDVQRAIGFICR